MVNQYAEVCKLLDHREYDKVRPVLKDLTRGKCPQTFLTAGSLYIDMQGWRQGETDRSILAEIGKDQGVLSYKRSYIVDREGNEVKLKERRFFIKN